MARSNKGFIMMYVIVIVGLAMTAMLLLSQIMIAKQNTTSRFNKKCSLENAFISAENWYKVNYLTLSKEMSEPQVLPIVIKGTECEMKLSQSENSTILIVIEGEQIYSKRSFAID